MESCIEDPLGCSIAFDGGRFRRLAFRSFQCIVESRYPSEDLWILLVRDQLPWQRAFQAVQPIERPNSCWHMH